ncbi:MAG: precorrin-6A/cobalt-precorrin-6A reductase, partial [Coriobacteriia bacterium]|nr:precorrin-6A/cobalt-precorrin-6A reductase [Coriobacteriia bacterium]
RALATYVPVCRQAAVRCIARVLPTADSIAAAAAAGLAPADIVALQGPTSVELDAALLAHLRATVIVTKESGPAGGVPDKLTAARQVGATAVVVARHPMTDADAGTDADADAMRSIDELVAHVAAFYAAPAPAAPTSAPSGLVHVYTGTGKGKTSAGVGLAVRGAGARLKVAFVQFVKGGSESSELASLRQLGVQVIRPAEEPTGLLAHGITDADRAAAAAALTAARSALAGAFDLVVLDEACVAADKGLLTAAELVQAVSERAVHTEAALTGRGAPPELLAIADYVTDMRLVAHPYYRGVGARKGIEY